MLAQYTLATITNHWQMQCGERGCGGSIDPADLFLLPIAREGNVFTGVCLSTVGLMDIGSLLGLVMARSVHILPECFLVSFSCSFRGNFAKILGWFSTYRVEPPSPFLRNPGSTTVYR